MKSINLIFGCHSHQPVGNFDFVFAEAYEKAYKPFIDVLERFPAVHVTLHYTGPLWDWFLAHAPDYIARRGLPVTPSDIEQHALVTTPPGSPLLDLTLTRGEEVRSLHLLGDIQINSVEGILETCLAGGGLAVLPSYMVCDYLMAGRLVPVLPDYTVPDTVIQAVFPSSRHLSIKVRAFIDFLVARFSPVPPWECVDRMPAVAPRAELVEAD